MPHFAGRYRTMKYSFLTFSVLIAALTTFIAFAPSPAPAQSGKALGTAAFYKPGMGPYSDIDKVEGQLAMPGRKKALQYRAVFSRSAKDMPVIIWSHGAFGSHSSYTPLAEYWASHGYLVLQPTHSDSMREGTVPLVKNPLVFKDWAQRPREVSYIIDQLQNLETLIPALKGRVDRQLIGIGGHSYGAQTTQLLAGMTGKRGMLPRDEPQSFREERAQAFVIVSPQGTSAVSNKAAFAGMTVPFLMITGTNDKAANNDKDYTWRLEAWNNAPAGPDRFLLLIDGAYHGFGGISGTVRFTGAGPADDNTVEAVRGAALAMFDAQLRGSRDAQIWLETGTISTFDPSRSKYMMLSK